MIKLQPFYRVSWCENQIYIVTYIKKFSYWSITLEMEYNWKIQSVVSLIYYPHSKFSEKRNRKVIEWKLLPICGNVFTSEGAGSFSFFMLSANNKTKK